MNDPLKNAKIVRRSWRSLADKKIAAGTDLVAFRGNWWHKYRRKFPDMFISCEAFDFMLRKLIEADNPDFLVRLVLARPRHFPRYRLSVIAFYPARRLVASPGYRAAGGKYSTGGQHTERVIGRPMVFV